MKKTKKNGASVDLKWAEKNLWELLHIEGGSGREKSVSDYIRHTLGEVGCPGSAMRSDGADKRIPLPCETGNLIVTVPGSGELAKSPRIIFSAHMDTVDIVLGTKPKKTRETITGSKGHALGADNRAGVAAIMSMLHTVLKTDTPHPPLTVAFTVREETGLWGARYIDMKKLKKPAMGFNFDGGRPAAEFAIQAPGGEKMKIEIAGIASHAGGSPDHGVSAAAVAALAIAELHEKGLHGLVAEGANRATSNIGTIHGGSATNVVCPDISITAEARAYRLKKLESIVRAYRKAFERAVKKISSVDGRRGGLKFAAEKHYYPFKLNRSEPVVKKAVSVAKSIGLEASLMPVGGGLDANWLVRHGIPVITAGCGNRFAHTVKEVLFLPEFRDSCRLAAALATG